MLVSRLAKNVSGRINNYLAASDSNGLQLSLRPRGNKAKEKSDRLVHYIMFTSTAM